jgi:rod shape determining protein RodA
MCYGFAGMLAAQTIVNIGMCLSLLPVIGITLPFFSAGGSSNLCVYIGVGLILSIYRFDKEKQAVRFRFSNLTPFTGT